MKDIVISGAREGNLKSISLRIPREKLVVLTGVSGSGKSTLLIDVLFNECQRQYLEAMDLQGIRKPQVESIRGVSPAVCITQRGANRNPRSTVGTVTNIYTELRMLYEKLAVRNCPHCGASICAADCFETTEKRGGDFFVYMDCCVCGKRMDKLTRTQFSYNTKEGACPECQGLGQTLKVDRTGAVDERRSLEDGAVRFWAQKYAEYQTAAFYAALRHYGLPVQPGTAVEAYSDLQKAVLYEGTSCSALQETFPNIAVPKTVAQGRFEGVEPMLWRRLQEKGGDAKGMEGYFLHTSCRACGGERLNPLSRGAAVRDVRLPQLSALSLDGLRRWLEKLEQELPSAHQKLVEPYLLDLQTKLRRLSDVGLGYLSLERQAGTLSGGETQRLRLAAALDSDITGIFYMLDEPTVGLHPQDTQGMIDVLKQLRDNGNTVLVIEHDPDVMRAADHIIDIGPGAGRHGGQVVGSGTLEELAAQPDSVTGAWLARHQPQKRTPRAGDGRRVKIRNACLHNLQNVDAEFPVRCLSAVTGVSGSGKSSLVFGVLADEREQRTHVAGLEHFSRVVVIEQEALVRMRRSNVATYTGLYSDIRSLFAATPQAKKLGLGAGAFSFNTKGGRCETCEGLGVVPNNLLFFADTEITCPVCGGRRFGEKVLSVRWNGKNISDILSLSVEEAMEMFAAERRLAARLHTLCGAGLGYLELGQTLTTLSGGEGQRLKLAKELMEQAQNNVLYLMDEPTVGLHPLDVEHFLALLNGMVEGGATVIAVEHNQQVIAASDWVVELGPGGGVDGGRAVFSGTPQELAACTESATGRFLEGW